MERGSHAYFGTVPLITGNTAGGPVGSLSAGQPPAPTRIPGVSVLQRETERLTLLQNLATRLTSAPDEVAFGAALEAIHKGLGVPKTAVLTCLDGKAMTFRMWRGISESYRTAVEGHSPWDAGVENPTPIAVTNVDREPSLESLREVLASEGIASLVFLPILNDRRLIGKFMLYDSQPRDWTASDIAYGQTVASLMSLIIHRSRVEDTLRSANSELFALAQHIPIGIVFEDATRRIQFYNQPFLEMAGLSDVDLAGEPRSARVLWEQRKILAQPENFRTRTREIVNEGEGVQGEELILKDGRIIEQGYCPVMDGTDVVGHLWSYRDVTEQRWMERQVVQGTKMESLGALAGGIAHDFNNLLTSILGYGAMARRELGPHHPALPYLKQLLKVAGQAADITRQLKTFAAHQPSAGQSLDITQAVWESADMLRRLLGPNIDLVCTGLETPLWVRANPAQVNQVLINLVVNARDAMPQGGELRVTLKKAIPDMFGPASAKGQGYVEMTVADTGTGMDDTTRHRIFEPFFSTKEIGKGSGLGLSTCYGIVAGAGGTIEYETTPGAGTTFRVYWPTGSPNVQQPPQETAPRSERAASVLIVEDEEFVREVLLEALESSGYDADAVANADEALDRLHDGRSYDLLVTDAAMPGMSGPELIERVRTSHPHMKALLISGYVGDRTMGSRELPFLQKPFMPDDFVRRVAELLDSAPAPSEDVRPDVA